MQCNALVISDRPAADAGAARPSLAKDTYLSLVRVGHLGRVGSIHRRCCSWTDDVDR